MLPTILSPGLGLRTMLQCCPSKVLIAQQRATVFLGLIAQVAPSDQWGRAHDDRWRGLVTANVRQRCDENACDGG